MGMEVFYADPEYRESSLCFYCSQNGICSKENKQGTSKGSGKTVYCLKN
jgi:hypothetical protein